MIDNRPRLLRQRVNLHASPNQIHSLRRRNPRPIVAVLQEHLLDLLQSLIRLRSLLHFAPELLRELWRVGGEALDCLVEWGVALELGWGCGVFVFDEEG